MLVAHHFLSRDCSLGFSNNKPMSENQNVLPVVEINSTGSTMEISQKE